MPNVGGSYQKDSDGKRSRVRPPTATQVRRSGKKAETEPSTPKPGPSKTGGAEETPKPKSSKPSGKSQD
ncbi:hypothetical protein QMT40_002985 [Parvibaculaceae bacterium PLY_AMNH_Bact1]|nr:hypothetical protein QMT40_002985 [Parvibaculaceae bacterium PLY_AMNH_Bact1]